MKDDWVVIRASDTGQKPKDAPDSILFEFHRRLQLVRVKRGRVTYVVPLRLYEEHGESIIDAVDKTLRRVD